MTQNYHLNFGDQTEVSVFLWKSPCAGSSKASTAENIISLFLRCHFSSVHQTLRYLNGYPKDPTPVGTRQTPGIYKHYFKNPFLFFPWHSMKVHESSRTKNKIRRLNVCVYVFIIYLFLLCVLGLPGRP